MARVKVDYGIDLGTTNSAISRMENGEPTIRKTDTLKDTMPSSVYINKKKAIQVGDSAYNALRREKLKAMKNWDESMTNAFIEFKRTMGTDKLYESINLGKNLSSEELSAEALKTLKSFIKDESVHSIVITVPAAFKINQIDATRRAGELAGFDHIEVLQEPVAAAMAYGLNAKNKNGFWLVFDFGGGTFDAALLKVEEGIMEVIDTEGDNYLGGKNLDFAIVDEIILPYLQENFVIDSILSDDSKKQILRNAMKFYAEETKIKLSFNDTHNILSDLGDIPGEDDEGEEFELDIMISQADIERALAPIFQKAINISLDLLKQNNLNGSSLDSLILVGGPTFSPVLRKMLEEQICSPDTSADPMTVVSKGAALYASTIDVSEGVLEQTRDKTKIQLKIENDTTSVETELFVPIKILPEKTEGEIPKTIFAEFTRGDKAWSSGKVEINEIGDIIEVLLVEGKTNVFNVTLFNTKGDILDCEPNSFNVIQGIGGADSMGTLPYNWGIEVKQRTTGKIVFKKLKGLEKNKSLPATGIDNELKTQKQIRPGMEFDFIKIPIYQGEKGADGTRAIYNDHVYDVIINGNDLPALLPENSNVELTVSLNKSQNVSVHAFFPYLDHTAEIEVPRDNVQSVKIDWLANEIKKAKGTIQELKQDNNHSDDAKLEKVNEELQEIEKSFENNKNDVDNNHEVLTNLRKSLKVIDELNDTTEWPKLEEDLKDEFYRLEQANDELGNEETTQIINQLRKELEEVIQTKNVKLGNVLLEEITRIFVQITFVYQLIGFIRNYNDNFGSYHWKDSSRARALLNQGLQNIGEHPTVDVLHPIVISLLDLLPVTEKPSGDDSVLVG
jgi:molecular chaperone DnaK